MATIPAPGTHPKPKVTVSPEALSKTRTIQSTVGIALVFGTLLDRFLQPAVPAPRAEEQDPEPVGAAS